MKERTPSQADEVEKIVLPDLPWQIDPSHLAFDEEKPNESLLNSSSVRIFQTNKGEKKVKVYEESPLGKGSFGTVYAAQDPKTHQWLAVKTLSDTSFSAFMQEVKALEESGVLEFYDSRTNTIGMKLLKGHELYNAIVDDKENKKLSPQHFSLLQRIAIAKEVVKKITGVHKDHQFIKKQHEIKIIKERNQHELKKQQTENKESEHGFPSTIENEIQGENDSPKMIIHRDIKTNNIMLDASGLSVEYCDFGLARKLDPEKKLLLAFASDVNGNLLETARTRGNPILIMEKTPNYNFKFKIYGDSKGDGKWDFAEINIPNADKESLRILTSLPYFAGVIKRNDPFFSPLLAKIVDQNHAASSSSNQDMKPTIGKIEDTNIVGTPMFMAPELLEAKIQGKTLHYTEETEMYAIGWTLAEILGLAQFTRDC